MRSRLISNRSARSSSPPSRKGYGAKRALIPLEDKLNFLDVSADIKEQVDPIFYSDPKTATLKVLGVS